jgi:hypothetical protein
MRYSARVVDTAPDTGIRRVSLHHPYNGDGSRCAQSPNGKSLAEAASLSQQSFAARLAASGRWQKQLLARRRRQETAPAPLMFRDQRTLLGLEPIGDFVRSVRFDGHAANAALIDAVGHV